MKPDAVAGRQLLYLRSNIPQEIFPSPDAPANLIIEEAADVKHAPHQRDDDTVIKELPNHSLTRIMISGAVSSGRRKDATIFAEAKNVKQIYYRLLICAIEKGDFIS
jgi:hypothetical protein